MQSLHLWKIVQEKKKIILIFSKTFLLFIEF